MIELQIDITDVEDIRAVKNSVARFSIASAATEILRSGGRVVFKRSYCNTPDDIFSDYKSAEAFKKDWDDFFARLT
ncbi:MAG: hypothetical protein LBE50_06770 [Gallionellaceae bacterium]|nr:hypothetical protein [Gallionellaceae bacterium]